MESIKLSFGVVIKCCPLGLEGQATFIANRRGAQLTSYEHCHQGNALLIHYLSKTGKYLRTAGCENCVLKNGNGHK